MELVSRAATSPYKLNSISSKSNISINNKIPDILLPPLKRMIQRLTLCKEAERQTQSHPLCRFAFRYISIVILASFPKDRVVLETEYCIITSTFHQRHPVKSKEGPAIPVRSEVH